MSMKEEEEEEELMPRCPGRCGSPPPGSGAVGFVSVACVEAAASGAANKDELPVWRAVELQQDVDAGRGGGDGDGDGDDEEGEEDDDVAEAAEPEPEPAAGVGDCRTSLSGLVAAGLAPVLRLAGAAG